jgi:sulfopyruvate decarboxylase alpha subunit
MATAAGSADDGAAQGGAWHEIVVSVLKANGVRFVPYVPDNVLKPLIAAVHADPFFAAFPVAREEEGVGIVAGGCMAGTKGVVLMQTSGFATLANALASLPCAFQIPVLLLVSERGTLGEFNIGQAMVWRTMRPVLDALGMEHHRITRLDECGFICDRTIKQAAMTQQPAALILSPLLTGGKVPAAAPEA